MSDTNIYPEIEYELRCNECHAIFEEAVADEFCPECHGTSLFEREVFPDPLDWPEIPVLQPITVFPVSLSAPEFSAERIAQAKRDLGIENG